MTCKRGIPPIGMKGTAVPDDQNAGMFAVRLSPKIVDVIKSQAAAEGKTIRDFILAVISSELEHCLAKPRRRESTENVTSIDDSVHSFLATLLGKEGKVAWTDKKMLAVRLPYSLILKVNNYADEEKKNVQLIVEEFICIYLVRKQGRELDIEMLDNLIVRTPHKNYKKRQRV